MSRSGVTLTCASWRVALFWWKELQGNVLTRLYPRGAHCMPPSPNCPHSLDHALAHRARLTPVVLIFTRHKCRKRFTTLFDL